MWRRSDEPGTADPAAVQELMFTIVQNKMWQYNLALGLMGSASGSMMLFLLGVFIWRRSLVNRVSLRLIFAISLFDFAQCMLQTIPPMESPTRRRAASFFIDLFTSSSIYLSSSIAFNLQMTFLRKSRSPLPGYVQYLYYVVPVLAAAIQFVPQYIWAAKHGYIYTFDPIMPGTRAYFPFITLAMMGPPTIFLLYNVITSGRVICSLYIKQRQVGRALASAMQRTTDLLSESRGSGTVQGSSGDGSGSRASFREQQQLKTVRRVYWACIRIALYPLAPLTWYVMVYTFLVVQYFYTFDRVSDAYAMARLLSVSWYSSSVLAMTNFVVFLTDAAVIHVIQEVRRAITSRFRPKQKSGSDDDLPADRRRKSDKKTGVAIRESEKTKASSDDDISIDSSDLEIPDPGAANQADSSGALEFGRPYTTSLSGLEDDTVTRRVRGGADAQSLLGDM
ncbi:hypothetical protein H4R19_001026 [Coemansia spiralis]|nr:hypothetical protein H4R19_001026 [Coemansia spiralis]